MKVGVWSSMMLLLAVAGLGVSARAVVSVSSATSSAAVHFGSATLRQRTQRVAGVVGEAPRRGRRLSVAEHVCHSGLRQMPNSAQEDVRAGCDAHARASMHTMSATSSWPELASACGAVSWAAAGGGSALLSGNSAALAEATNPVPGVDVFGSCFAANVTDGVRYISANGVPNHWVAPSCPGVPANASVSDYCMPTDLVCPFVGMRCGPLAPGGRVGSTGMGDVWVPYSDRYAMPAVVNPTSPDVPRGFYATVGASGTKTAAAAVGVALNGVAIFGPNDAGGKTVDQAGMALACGGHVTPPVNAGPRYHYHKLAECMPVNRAAALDVSSGGTPLVHSPLYGYALDGAGIYGLFDAGGATPAVDECGGHFGPVPDAPAGSPPVYHYHTRPYAPYTLACQGPALGACEETQSQTLVVAGVTVPGANFCGPGCGADVCIQPNSDVFALAGSLHALNATWFTSYTNNLFEWPTEFRAHIFDGVSPQSLAATIRTQLH